jgi:hypothetical protein
MGEKKKLTVTQYKKRDALQKANTSQKEVCFLERDIETVAAILAALPSHCQAADASSKQTRHLP